MNINSGKLRISMRTALFISLTCVFLLDYGLTANHNKRSNRKQNDEVPRKFSDFDLQLRALHKEEMNNPEFVDGESDALEPLFKKFAKNIDAIAKHFLLELQLKENGKHEQTVENKVTHKDDIAVEFNKDEVGDLVVTPPNPLTMASMSTFDDTAISDDQKGENVINQAVSENFNFDIDKREGFTDSFNLAYFDKIFENDESIWSNINYLPETNGRHEDHNLLSTISKSDIFTNINSFAITKNRTLETEETDKNFYDNINNIKTQKVNIEKDGYSISTFLPRADFHLDNMQQNDRTTNVSDDFLTGNALSNSTANNSSYAMHKDKKNILLGQNLLIIAKGYHFGLGRQVNRSLACKYYKSAMFFGCIKAAFEFAMCIYEGFCTSHEPQHPYKPLVYAMGILTNTDNFKDALNVISFHQISDATTTALFSIGSSLRIPVAMAVYGDLIISSQGRTNEEIAKALESLHIAAENSETRAYISLVSWYERPEQIKQSKSLQMLDICLKQLALQGHHESIFKLAQMRWNASKSGKECLLRNRAVYYARKALSHGNGDAGLWLANHILTNKIPEMSTDDAISILNTAGSMSNGLADLKLGDMYYFGYYKVPIRFEMATYHYKRAQCTINSPELAVKAYDSHLRSEIPATLDYILEARAAFCDAAIKGDSLAIDALMRHFNWTTNHCIAHSSAQNDCIGKTK